MLFVRVPTKSLDAPGYCDVVIPVSPCAEMFEIFSGSNFVPGNRNGNVRPVWLRTEYVLGVFTHFVQYRVGIRSLPSVPPVATVNSLRNVGERVLVKVS